MRPYTTSPQRTARPGSARAGAARKPRGNPYVEETVDLLNRRRWLILSAVVLAGLAAAGYAYTRTPMYSTSALVLVDLDRATDGGGAGAGAATAGPDGSVAPGTVTASRSRSVQTELFVLNSSRGIRERVQARLGDDKGRLPPGAVSFSLADRNVASGIRIDAVGPDPNAAAALANAYAEEYVAQTQLASRSYLTETREFLEQQAGRLRGQVASADAAVVGRMSAAGAAGVGSGPLLSQLSALRGELGEAQIDRQMRTNRLASINSQLSDITPKLAERVSSSTDREMAQVEQEITALEAQLRTFDQRQSAGRAIDETQAGAIRSRIAALEARKVTIGARYVNEVMSAGGIAAPTEALSYVTDLQGQAAQERIAISGLNGKISQLSSRIAQVSGEAGRAPSQTISVERASQDREAASQTYSTVAQQLERVRVQEASEPGYARVLRSASVPVMPGGPGWLRVLGLALAFGLAGGLGLAVVLDRLDNRVYKPEHVAALGIPVLEAVPDLDPVVRDVLGGVETLPVGGFDVVSELVTLHAPLSPAAETYRHLRTAVQFSRPDTVIETLLVTSAAPGEGKSTTAANLAVAFAQGGRTTVLIDTDFRRPRVHEVFGMPARKGLYQLLQSQPARTEPLLAVLQEHFSTGVEGLFAVPAGAIALEDLDDGPTDGRPVIGSPAEILGSPGLRALLEALREAVDIIVIDTPPVLVATDAVLLSTQADATLLVTSAGTSKSGDIEQALAHLDDVGAHVVGAVLNRFSLDKALGYAYTYGHYSRYGAYSKYAYGTKNGAKPGRKKPHAAAPPAVLPAASSQPSSN